MERPWERGPLARIPGSPRLAARMRASGPRATTTTAVPCSLRVGGRPAAGLPTRMERPWERGPLARIPGSPRLAARLRASGPRATTTTAVPCSLRVGGPAHRRVAYSHPAGQGIKPWTKVSIR